MEYALRVTRRNSLRIFTVLILVLMEYALRDKTAEANHFEQYLS